MTKIIKQKEFYVINFDSTECNTIVVKKFDWVKIACELRLNKVFLIKIPFRNVWYAIEIPKVISKIISIFKQKINSLLVL